MYADPDRNFRAPKLYSREWLRDSTPSRQDGISFEKEEEYRQAYCHLLVDVGQKLPVPQWAVGTAICYCHRFFARKSMKRNDRFTIAVAAMFLACKVEEVSKSLETCIREFWDQRYRSRIGRTEDELRKAREKVSDPKFMESYKQSVLVAERALLYALNFDLATCTVHGMLVPLAKEVGWADERELIQAAWNFVNDSLRTTVSLQAPAEAVAVAILVLTARLFGKGESLQDANHQNIWQVHNIHHDVIKSVIDQIVELYTTPSEARAMMLMNPGEPASQPHPSQPHPSQAQQALPAGDAQQMAPPLHPELAQGAQNGQHAAAPRLPPQPGPAQVPMQT